jgi:3-hydroxyacyl-CoA dehydrogenase
VVWQLPAPLGTVYRASFPDSLLGETPLWRDRIRDTNALCTPVTIAILSFKSKMHTVSNEVLDGILRAVDEAEQNFSALILWQTEAPFSAGANLLQLMQGRQEAPDSGMFDKLKGAVNRVKYTAAGGGGVGDLLKAATGNVPKVEAVVAKFQQASQRLKYAQVPTIAAVDGLALGGGCEFAIHCARTVATLESYIGLVEVGVGLLPAGGGCKEMAMRAAAEAQRLPSRAAWMSSAPQALFQNIAMGEVAKAPSSRARWAT